ncbi:hypothetical protein [Chromatium okenii]|jgi:hypothetical protein|uniref:hypothetical protein n=1 Tax=Chromatium okenii TaxID=61644 RepID=UPI0026EEE0D0|nr:hypothetical protein [Chromatium okenii]
MAETETRAAMTLHPQFITDEDGSQLSVVLSLEEYEVLLNRLEDLEDYNDALEALIRIERGEEKTILWKTVKAECGL